VKKQRIIVVVGTRPEAIKMAPVYLAFKKEDRAEILLLATAQHRQMLDQVLSVFGIRPDIDLDIMRPNQTLGELTSSLIRGTQKVFAELKPDVVLVQGDTTTCFCAALAAFYERVPIGHVEAGLRTYDLSAPWPEEMNRRLVAPLTRWSFAPTERAAENLLSERIPPENIFVTGNTVIDALFIARDMGRTIEPTIPGLKKEVLEEYRLVLVTGHRRENFGEPFREFCLALRDIVRTHPDTIIIYPVHLNPNVQKPVYEILAREDRIYLIPPVEYLPFVYLMDRSYIIITDSGGIQEEAPSLHKPVLVTRDITERQETVTAGLAKLVGTNRRDIVEAATRLLNDKGHYTRMSKGNNPYGDGKASERIVKIFLG